MLELKIDDIELYDEKSEEFVEIKGTTLQLEHSLISISKWESKWHKAFLGKSDKTQEEILDYIRCMTINKNVDPNLYKYLSHEHIKQVVEYIEEPMTATCFYDDRKSNSGGSKETVTAELIYYWMIALQIPIEFQRWHLNKLLTLIRVCNIKNDAPNNKMSKREIMNRNKALNDARRKALNTRG